MHVYDHPTDMVVLVQLKLLRTGHRFRKLGGGDRRYALLWFSSGAVMEIKLPGRRRRASNDGEEVDGVADGDAEELAGPDHVEESDTFEDAADTHHETDSMKGVSVREGQEGADSAASDDDEETGLEAGECFAEHIHISGDSIESFCNKPEASSSLVPCVSPNLLSQLLGSPDMSN